MRTREKKHESRGARRRRVWAGPLFLALLFVLLGPSAAWAKMLSVKVGIANFRSGPSAKHSVLFTADRYYPVKVLGRKNGWVHVSDFEGDQAWVARWVLGVTKTVVVKSELVNVRRSPSTRSAVAHQAEKGAVYRVIGRKANWVKIGFGAQKTGWIRADLVWGHIPAKR